MALIKAFSEIDWETMRATDEVHIHLPQIETIRALRNGEGHVISGWSVARFSGEFDYFVEMPLEQLSSLITRFWGAKNSI